MMFMFDRGEAATQNSVSTSPSPNMKSMKFALGHVRVSHDLSRDFACIVGRQVLESQELLNTFIVERKMKVLFIMIMIKRGKVTEKLAASSAQTCIFSAS